MKQLLKALDRAMEGMTFLGGVLLIFIMLSVCGDVILRTFFNYAQMWVTEVTECILLYITFLAAAWLLREEAHVRVDIVIEHLKPRTTAFLNIISSLIGVFVSIVLTIFGIKVTLDYFQRGIYTPTAMEIPVYLILLIIPIGSFFLSAQFIRRMLLNLTGFFVESSRTRNGS